MGYHEHYFLDRRYEWRKEEFLMKVFRHGDNAFCTAISNRPEEKDKGAIRRRKICPSSYRSLTPLHSAS